MVISEDRIRKIINEEIKVYRSDLTAAQFGYIIHALMSNPGDEVSNDLYEPKQGKLILRKGQSLSDISDTAAYYLYKYHNIDLDPDAYGRKSKPKQGTERQQSVQQEPRSTGPSEVSSVASSLLGYVRSGSEPLRNDIKNIVADIKRDEIAVYLNDPKNRIATDQEIACALRYLLDQKVQASGKFIINPCGFGQEQSETLIVIVKL